MTEQAASADKYAGISIDVAYEPGGPAENQVAPTYEAEDLDEGHEAQAPETPPPEPLKKAEPDHDERGKDETQEDYSKRVQKRINKEIGKRKTAEDQLAELKKENEQLKAAQGTKPTPEKPAATTPEPEVEIDLPKPLSAEELHKKALDMIGAEPKEDAFDDFDAFHKAQLKYEVDIRIAEIRLEDSDKKRIDGEVQKQQTFKERLDEGKKRWKDFIEVIANPAIQITAPMVAVLQDCEKAAEITYYLGKNPTEAAKIARMTPKEQERQLLILEARFIADPKSIPPPTVDDADADAGTGTEAIGEDEDLEEPEEPDEDDNEAATGTTSMPPVTPPATPVKKVSVAPKPITPVNSGATVGHKDPDKMTPNEYRAWRKAGGGRG